MNVVMMVVEERRWRRVGVVCSDGDVSFVEKRFVSDPLMPALVSRLTETLINSQLNRRYSRHAPSPIHS